MQSVLISTQEYRVPCGMELSSGHFRLSLFVLFFIFLKVKLEYRYDCCVLLLKSLLLAEVQLGTAVNSKSGVPPLRTEFLCCLPQEGALL